MSKLVTIAVLQDAINNLGLPEKITRTQLEYWRAGSRAVIRALNEAIQAAPSIEGVAQTDQKQPESRANAGLNGVVQACPDGGAQRLPMISVSDQLPLTWCYQQDGGDPPYWISNSVLGLMADGGYGVFTLQRQEDGTLVWGDGGANDGADVTHWTPLPLECETKSDAPPSASPWIWTGAPPPPGQAVIEYRGAGEYQVSTNWDGAPSWYMLIPAVPNENEGPGVAAAPAPPANKAGVSGSEAPVSDKPACGAQNVEYERQADKADAERYRFIRDNIMGDYTLPGSYYIPDEDTETWDRTIDASMKHMLHEGSNKGAPS